MTIDGRPAPTTATDQQDGSYLLDLALTRRADPSIDLSVLGVSLYQGEIRGIDLAASDTAKGKKWVVAVLILIGAFVGMRLIAGKA